MRIRNVTLLFERPETERSYREATLERSLLYTRVAWVTFFIAVLVFGYLDRASFGEQMYWVTGARAVTALLAAMFIASTFVGKLRPLLRMSSPLFILISGILSILLTGLGAGDRFSPYVMSFCFAFSGIFTTPGIGFYLSVVAMLTVLFGFNATFLFGHLVPEGLFAVYDFFITGLIVVFSVAGYLVERTLRHDFLISTKLRESLQEVKTLSGLLPICASCKKVRDDGGYWRQIEAYLTAHTHASFTHGICPECIDKLYPDVDIKKETDIAQ